MTFMRLKGYKVLSSNSTIAISIVGFLLAAPQIRAQALTLQRLTIKNNSTAVNGTTLASPKGNTWRLGSTNQTSKIEAAYKYGEWVIAFGWIGCCAGNTTIIDSKTGLERLEFLSYDPQVTPQGQIIFREFYPHFTDQDLISDKIRELDLNQPFAYAVPGTRQQNPLSSTGFLLYPPSSAPIPGQRHEIGHNFVITAGKTLFVADHLLPSDKLCIAKLNLPTIANNKITQTCVESGSLIEQPSTSSYVTQLRENAFGELALSVSSKSGKPELSRDYIINDTTLAPELAKPRAASQWCTANTVASAESGVN